MFRRLRQFVESIMFAGMTPGAPAPQSQRLRWLGPLRRPVERLVSGGATPLDPLYLTNRTIGQRIRAALAIAVPCMIVLSLTGLAVGNYFVKKNPPAKPELSPAELAAKMLPNLDDVRIDTNRDVDIMEVHIDRTSGTALTGTVKNNTAHQIETADIVFDLTDSAGSQLGGVKQRLENLAPQTRTNFRLPIEQNTARFALVREVKTR